MVENVVRTAVGNMITDVIQNSVSGFVEAGTRTIGGYAGDFIIRGGDIIENAGRGLGSSISTRGELWGDSIKGYYGGSTPSLSPVVYPRAKSSSTISTTTKKPTAKAIPAPKSSSTIALASRPKQPLKSYSLPSASVKSSSYPATRPKVSTPGLLNPTRGASTSAPSKSAAGTKKVAVNASGSSTKKLGGSGPSVKKVVPAPESLPLSRRK